MNLKYKHTRTCSHTANTTKFTSQSHQPLNKPPFPPSAIYIHLLRLTSDTVPGILQLQARVYLLSSGFSLAFGSMFAKTYRVHRIFTLTGGGGVCKDKMLRDTQLISLVCALLLLDGLVVTLWVVVDPMERHLSNLTLEISLTDRSVVYQPQVSASVSARARE